MAAWWEWGEWMRGYVWLSPLAVHLKLSQQSLLIGCTPVQNKKLKEPQNIVFDKPALTEQT